MLRLGARTGYDIKRAAELSTRFFWTISPVQIYPELKRLEAAGLIDGRDDSRGRRRRRSYELTPEGLAALGEWLTRAEPLSLELRDAGQLKIFFGDALEPGEAIANVRAMRERHEHLAERFRTEIEPRASRLADHEDKRFPLIVAQFGRELNEWVAERCGRLEEELASGGHAQRQSERER
jgi:PadR family transcriptional regulator AphA